MAGFADMWEDTTRSQRYAIAGAVFNVVLLVLFQFVLTPGEAAPLPLFLLFVGLWIFGAVMLVVLPTFGAVGTAAWGFLAAGAAWRTHASFDLEDVSLISASLGGGLLALGFLIGRIQSRMAR